MSETTDKFYELILENIESIEFKGTKWTNPRIIKEQSVHNTNTKECDLLCEVG